MGLKDFFTRRNINLKDPDFDLYKYHPQIKVFFAINGIFFNNKESKMRFVWPSICLFMATIGIFLEVSFILHGIHEKDYAVATESFCYFIILACIPIVIISILCNRQKVYGILTEMNEHFIYILTLEPKYKNPFLQGQLLVWKLCYVWMAFSTVVSSTFIITCFFKLFYQSLFATQDVNTVRPLAFPIFLSFIDPYRSPYYELFLLLEIIIVYAFVQSFSVFVYVLFHILLHCIYLMKMIFLDLDVIFDGLDENVAALSKHDPRRVEAQLILNRRLRRIVDWHTSLFKLVDLASSVFGPPLAFQVSISSIAICLMAYQIVDYMEQGKFHFLFLLMTVSAYIQLWIPCYLGSLVRNQAFEVGEACWRCGWQNTALGLLVRPDITIMICRAQRPLSIEFPGLPRMELNTFSSILTSSYSYFNILRQYK